jgi:hypothetical protein
MALTFDGWTRALDRQPPAERLQQGAAIFLRNYGWAALILLLFGALSGWEYTIANGLSLRLDVLALTYPLGAALTGALFGLWARALRRLPAALVSGPVATLPWAAGIVVAVDRGWAEWTPLHSLMLLGFGLLMGLITGFKLNRWVQP